MNKNKVIPEKISIVPDIRRGDSVRTGPIWLTAIIPIQNPELHIDIMKPVLIIAWSLGLCQSRSLTSTLEWKYFPHYYPGNVPRKNIL